MEQLETFFAMGGYGRFVWPAFALTAAVMIWLLVATLRRLRASERALAQVQETGGGRYGARGGAYGAPGGEEAAS